MNSPYDLPAECLNCHLRSDNFFCALSQESLEAFNQVKNGVVFPEGAVVFVEGQAPRGIFMLCQGQAKLSTTSRDGRALLLRIPRAAEILGLEADVTQQPSDVSVGRSPPGAP